MPRNGWTKERVSEAAAKQIAQYGTEDFSMRSLAAAATLAMPVFLFLTAFANLFGIGGVCCFGDSVFKAADESTDWKFQKSLGSAKENIPGGGFYFCSKYGIIFKNRQKIEWR